MNEKKSTEATDRLLGDRPITSPDDDVLGLTAFADALALSLTEMAPDDGLVVSVEGEWGSGKTSAIELTQRRIVIRELARERNIPLLEVESNKWDETIAEWDARVKVRRTHVVRFNPWNFSGQENLVSAFFKEVGAAIGYPPDSSIAKAIKKITDYLPTAGTVVGTGIGLATVGVPAGGVGSTLGRAIGQGVQRKLANTGSLEQAKQELADALRASEKRIVVIVDDLDRLLPSEMRSMFSLVKSLGDLPNVLYVLSFDRGAVTAALSKGMDGVDSEFLEKIVQVPLKLPPPWQHEIRSLFFQKLNSIIKDAEPNDIERWRHVYMDAVAPYFQTPRDVTRFCNTLKVMWPNVAGDIDLTDLIVILVFQIFEPIVFDLVFKNIEALSGDTISWEDDKKFASRFDPGGANNPEAAKKALAHLFPKLAKGWNAHTFDGVVYLKKREQRRICTREYYRNYFLFGRDPDRVSRVEIEAALASPNPKRDLTDLIERLAPKKSRQGVSLVAALLDQLLEIVFSKPLLSKQVVAALLALSDELIKREDKVWELFVTDNIERLDLILQFGLEPLPIDARVDRVMAMARSADGLSLGASVIGRLAGQHGLFGDQSRHESERYIERDIAEKAVAKVLARIRKIAKEGDLLSEARPMRLLFDWKRWSTSDEVRKWTAKQMRADSKVLKLAQIIPHNSYQSGGDGQKIVPIFKAKDFEEILDVDRLKMRLEQIARKAGPDSDATRVRSVLLEAEAAGAASRF